MTHQIQVAVIGAGVVGLACARAFARAGNEVIVIEKNNAFGQETSSRNSEVIHAGIYYPAGFSKRSFAYRGADSCTVFVANSGLHLTPVAN